MTHASLTPDLGTMSTVFPPPSGQPPPMQPGEYSPLSPSAVSYKRYGVDPPGDVYVQAGEQLVARVNALPGTTDTVTIAARLLLPHPPIVGQPDGTGTPPPGIESPNHGAYIQQLVFTVPVTGGVAASGSIQLPEGFLLSVAAVSTSLAGHGNTFVRCWLQQRGTPGATLSVALALFSGYVSAFDFMGWPGGELNHTLDGPGEIIEITVGNPAAGADWFYAVPPTERLRIQSWSAQLVTSATVANRVPRVWFKTAANVVFWQGQGQAVQAASLTFLYASGPGNFTTITDGVTVNPAMSSVAILGPSQKMEINTQNIQAGDQWSNIRIVAEAWLDNC